MQAVAEYERQTRFAVLFICVKEFLTPRKEGCQTSITGRAQKEEKNPSVPASKKRVGTR
jgi:hypothetical protein